MKTPKPQRPKLSRRALVRYDELSPDMDLSDHVTSDRLADYCQLWDEWTTASEKISELGAIVRVGDGLGPNPYVEMRDKAHRRMEEVALVLQLTPAVRIANAAFDHV